MEPLKHLKAIVFDWAGTMIDHGSRAPALVFQEIFRQQGIHISIDQAREPMGMAKREHIAAITRMPDVREQWLDRYQAECSEQDIDAMYGQFLPLQKETLKNHSQLIEGAAEACDLCRELGLKIGSSTGYTRELMEEVTVAARQQGYQPDLVLCAEDAPRGRPAPYLLFQAAIQLDVYPMSCVVKVDDTVVGIEAGVNAGCWNIGITRTGNLMGLSPEEVLNLEQQELRDRLQAFDQKLTAAGAHLTIDSVLDLEPALRKIDRAIGEGKIPATAGELG